MKKLLFIALLLCVSFLTSCSTDNSGDYQTTSDKEKTLMVSFNGDLSFESFTRSASIENSANDLWVFDYMDGNCVQTIHKIKGHSDFWNPSITLKYGKHNIYFLVSSASNPKQDGNVMYWDIIKDTFWNKMEVEIGNNTGSTLNVYVNRVVTMLKVKSSDFTPNNVKNLEIIPDSWYHGINYTTGEPASMTSKRPYVYQITDVGFSTEKTLYGFASENESKTNILFNICNYQLEAVKSFTVQNVPFKANRVTTLTGNMFNIQANTTWGLEYNLNW